MTPCSLQQLELEAKADSLRAQVARLQAERRALNLRQTVLTAMVQQREQLSTIMQLRQLALDKQPSSSSSARSSSLQSQQAQPMAQTADTALDPAGADPSSTAGRAAQAYVVHPAALAGCDTGEARLLSVPSACSCL